MKKRDKNEKKNYDLDFLTKKYNYMTWSFLPKYSGTYTIYVKITDNSNATFISNNITIAVNEIPTVTISSNKAIITLGESQQFNSIISGGTAPYSYQWYINGIAVSGTNNSVWNFSPNTAGNYSIYLNITDSLGVSTISNHENITVTATSSTKNSSSTIKSIPSFNVGLILLFSLVGITIIKRKNKL